jgi:hypothetical protein
MSNSKTITITKVGDDTPPSTPTPKLPVAPKKGGKTMRTYPRGVLKKQFHLKPVSDPARNAPLKKTMKKHVIHIITDKGAKKHRKTLRKRISKMSDQKVKELVTKNGLLKNPNTPPNIMREILEGGAIAGFVSLN